MRTVKINGNLVPVLSAKTKLENKYPANDTQSRGPYYLVESLILRTPAYDLVATRSQLVRHAGPALKSRSAAESASAIVAVNKNFSVRYKNGKVEKFNSVKIEPHAPELQTALELEAARYDRNTQARRRSEINRKNASRPRGTQNYTREQLNQAKVFARSERKKGHKWEVACRNAVDRFDLGVQWQTLYARIRSDKHKK